jgi:hypothetical protein
MESDSDYLNANFKELTNNYSIRDAVQMIYSKSLWDRLGKGIFISAEVTPCATSRSTLYEDKVYLSYIDSQILSEGFVKLEAPRWKEKKVFGLLKVKIFIYALLFVFVCIIFIIYCCFL